jgi:hypothetical protein
VSGVVIYVPPGRGEAAGEPCGDAVTPRLGPGGGGAFRAGLRDDPGRAPGTPTRESALGCPVTDKVDEPGGKTQRFQQATIHLNADRGTWVTGN